MPNQTLQQGIVKPASRPEARPGHSLVVYEESSRGRRFVKVVPPGQFFQPPILSFGRRFIGFWTMADPHLQIPVHRECKTRDQLYAYFLKANLSYRVKHPEQLIEGLDADPIHCLGERAAQLLCERLEHLDWPSIKHGGSVFRTAVLSGQNGFGGSSQPFLKQLGDFAADYGLEVIQVELDRALPEEELGVDLKFKAVAADRSILQATSMLDTERQRHKQEEKLRDTVVDSFKDMLLRSGDQVEGYSNVKKALQNVSQLVGPLGQIVGAPVGVQVPGIEVQQGDAVLLAAPSRGDDPLSRFLLEVCSQVGALDRRVRFQFASNWLHLIAEAVLLESANSGNVEAYRQRIEAAMDDDGELLDQLDHQFMRQFHDLKRLGKHLRGEA